MYTPHHYYANYKVWLSSKNECIISRSIFPHTEQATTKLSPKLFYCWMFSNNIMSFTKHTRYDKPFQNLFPRSMHFKHPNNNVDRSWLKLGDNNFISAFHSCRIPLWGNIVEAVTLILFSHYFSLSVLWHSIQSLQLRTQRMIYK